jgi:hypothetical protein
MAATVRETIAHRLPAGRTRARAGVIATMALALLLAVTLIACGEAFAQPAPAARPSSEVMGDAPPRPRLPPPLQADPSAQPGMGQPVVPQIAIPLGRRGVAASDAAAASTARAAASAPVIDDRAARCESLQSGKARAACLKRARSTRQAASSPPPR